MTWTDPNAVNWEVGDLITASDMKTYVRDNLLALKEPPSDNYELNESSDYTTTSTVFVDIDGTNLSLTITTSGGDVMVHFHGSIDVWGVGFLDVDVDGTREGGDDGILAIANGQEGTSCFTRLISGLSAGSHTFKLQWKSGASAAQLKLYAGAGTTERDVHPQFWVRELS